jgi:hypothetical protein
MMALNKNHSASEQQQQQQKQFVLLPQRTNLRQFSFSRQLSRTNSATWMKPIRQSINRAPFLLLRNHREHAYYPEMIETTILPNALLYHERVNGIPFDLSQITLESYRRREWRDDTNQDDDDDDSSSSTDDESSISDDSSLDVNELFQDDNNNDWNQGQVMITYHQQYVLFYKGEAVCVFRSSYEVHAHGTSGQSLSLTWRQRLGELQARILHKGRMATGQGWNAQEQRTYRVCEILDAAVERYAHKQPQQQQPQQQQSFYSQVVQQPQPQQRVAAAT